MVGKTKKIKPEEYVPTKDQVINIISISAFNREPIEIRDRLKAGEDYAVAWHKRPLCYIRHLAEDEREAWSDIEELPEGIDDVIGMHEIRTMRRNEFVDKMRSGKTFLITLYRAPLGLASSRYPESYMRRKQK